MDANACMEVLLRVTSASGNQMAYLIFISDFSQRMHTIVRARND